MRQAALLYNPDSGRSGHKRLKALESALAVLRGGGVKADLVPTESPVQAGAMVRQAIAAGCDTIFACGGDGTVHNIVQTLANSPVALALLPMGTANALAHDLGIPLDPPRAAKAALEATTRRVALGHVQLPDLQGHSTSRYFVITAGIGVDGHLFYKLLDGTKRKMGMAAYYAKAWHLWVSYPMTLFTAEYVETGTDQAKRADVTELMSVRIRNFGGVLRELAPGASFFRNDMRVVFSRTGSRWAYLRYVTRGLLGTDWRVPGVELAHCTLARCDYRDTSPGSRKIYVEADGELLGTLPAEISVVPDALTILVPRHPA